MWQELENRVFKTRFIIQKNFKNLQSLKHSLTSPDRIKSEREIVRSERGRPYKRERKSQIREGEKEIARARPGRATWGLGDPGRATQVTPAWVVRPRPPGSRNPGARLLLLRFFFFSFWLWFLFWLVLFWYIWALNRVFKTRFSSGQHVENDATSDVIKPWKSSLKDSIYCSKSSLLDSNC